MGLPPLSFLRRAINCKCRYGGARSASRVQRRRGYRSLICGQSAAGRRIALRRCQRLFALLRPSNGDTLKHIEHDRIQFQKLRRMRYGHSCNCHPSRQNRQPCICRQLIQRRPTRGRPYILR